MTALRQLRKVRRTFPLPLDCSRCHCDTPPGELMCEGCAGEQAEEAVRDDREDWVRDEMDVDAQRELARVYLDMRHGRYRDAMHRLESVLDSEAASWRELA